MKFQISSTQFIDTNTFFDLSMELSGDSNNPRAWYLERPKFEPVRANGWIGSVEEGGNVNFRDIYFNPHGHGTHTECLGHITKEIHSINEHFNTFFFAAEVITISPLETKVGNEIDFIVTKKQLENTLEGKNPEALILRTIPNLEAKKHQNYSNSNPPYLEASGANFLIEKGIKHLLLDLPSVDREQDGGVLAFHHAFWEVPTNPNFERTITEFIYVSDEIADGKYILNLQVAPFQNDAAPSRPIIFPIQTN